MFIHTLLSILAITSPFDWPKDRVEQYVKHSELQVRTSWELVSQIAWQGDEKILMLGCRDGRLPFFVSRMVRQGQVLALDPHTAFIEWAHKQYSTTDYPNLSFEQGNIFSTDDTFDAVISLFAMHLEQEAFLGEIFNHLKEGGKFYALIPPGPFSNPTWAQSVEQVTNQPKWKRFFKNHPEFLSLDHHFEWKEIDALRDILQAQGFEMEKLAFFPSEDPFLSKSALIDWYLGTIPQVRCVPESLRKSFVKEIIDRYVRVRPEAVRDGVYYGHWGRIELVAKRGAEQVYDQESCEVDDLSEIVDLSDFNPSSAP